MQIQGESHQGEDGQSGQDVGDLERLDEVMILYLGRLSLPCGERRLSSPKGPSPERHARIVSPTSQSKPSTRRAFPKNGGNSETRTITKTARSMYF